MLGRLSRKNTNYSTYTDSYTDFIAEESYTYRVFESNRTDSLLATYSYKVNSTVRAYYSYTYNSANYISKIVDINDNEVRYYYDSLGQLVREDNEPLGKTFVYEYDSAGNITKKNTYPLCAEGATPAGLIDINIYTYSSDDWGDLLTSFDGNAITYDAAGNPLTYPGGFTFTWQGKQLVGAAQGENVYSFTYNESGLRTSKTVNGVTTNYYWVGSLLAGEEKNGNFTRYLYDAKGSILAMQYHSSTSSENAWTTYWFEKNLQGDVVGVYNSSGTKLVSYTYDAFGNCTATTLVTGASSAANSRNPFRYRFIYYEK